MKKKKGMELPESGNRGEKMGLSPKLLGASKGAGTQGFCISADCYTFCEDWCISFAYGCAWCPFWPYD